MSNWTKKTPRPGLIPGMTPRRPHPKAGSAKGLARQRQTHPLEGELRDSPNAAHHQAPTLTPTARPVLIDPPPVPEGPRPSPWLYCGGLLPGATARPPWATSARGDLGHTCRGQCLAKGPNAETSAVIVTLPKVSRAREGGGYPGAPPRSVCFD